MSKQEHLNLQVLMTILKNVEYKPGWTFTIESQHHTTPHHNAPFPLELMIGMPMLDPYELHKGRSRPPMRVQRFVINHEMETDKDFIGFVAYAVRIMENYESEMWLTYNGFQLKNPDGGEPINLSNVRKTLGRLSPQSFPRDDYDRLLRQRGIMNAQQNIGSGLLGGPSPLAQHSAMQALQAQQAAAMQQQVNRMQSHVHDAILYGMSAMQSPPASYPHSRHIAQHTCAFTSRDEKQS